jgi:surfeit locus 1 family protein
MLHNKKIVSAMAFSMFAVLIALGIWQMQRLAWKQELLAKIDTRMSIGTEELPKTIDDPQAWEYRRVTLRGQFFKDHPFLIQPRMHKGKVGYHLVMPFEIKYGGVVYINRGWVSDETMDQVKSFSLNRNVTGVIQIPYQGKFTPDNDPQNNYWYWPDLEAMSKKSGIKSDYPVIVTLLPQPEGSIPTGYEVTANLRNNHRLYAFFWFGMALILSVVFIIYQKKQRNA